jgi:hypothetical protein
VCGTAPRVNELEPIDRGSGEGGFLEAFRTGQRPWSSAPRTKPDTCYVCNFALGDGAFTEYAGGICRTCLDNLSRGGE